MLMNGVYTPYNVDIEVNTSQLRYGESTARTIPFTNAEQIQIRLRDDIWTIDALSFRASADTLPFIELTGTFDAKSGMMDFHAESDGFALSPFAPAVGLFADAIPAGSGRYTAEINGTPEHPIIVTDWVIPKLDLKTEVGNIHINNAGGTVDYRDNIIHFEKTMLKLLGNAVDIAGKINVDPENINNSQLRFTANAPALKMTTFAELIARASENTIKSTDLTDGVLRTSVDITGTLAETSIALHAQTAPSQPIRLVPYTDPITLANLNANATLRSDSLRIESVEANGRVGDGSYEIQGDASFAIQTPEAMQFAMDVSASKLKVSDFVTLLSDEVSPIRGTVSGQAKLNGTGTDLHQISIIGDITELNLHGYDIDLTNNSEIQFQSEQGDLRVHLPLELKSPDMNTTTEVNITGTLEAPEITAKWNGKISEMEWNGDVEYRDERITVQSIEIKNRVGTSTITGTAPLNLAFTAMDISERFLDQPIGLRLRGYELPLAFFPGIDTLFSQADGTVDVDLAVQGTSRNPHVTGKMSLEAWQLQLKNFHEPIQNLKMELTAKENAIDLTELQFEMEPGYCTLQHGELRLDGLTPKEFTLAGLKFEKIPTRFNSTERNARRCTRRC